MREPVGGVWRMITGVSLAAFLIIPSVRGGPRFLPASGSGMLEQDADEGWGGESRQRSPGARRWYELSLV